MVCMNNVIIRLKGVTLEQVRAASFQPKYPMVAIHKMMSRGSCVCGKNVEKGMSIPLCTMYSTKAVTMTEGSMCSFGHVLQYLNDNGALSAFTESRQILHMLHEDMYGKPLDVGSTGGYKWDSSTWVPV